MPSTETDRHGAIAGLRLIAAVSTIGAIAVAAAVLWLLPWEIDALIAGSAATAWVWWLDKQEPS